MYRQEREEEQQSATKLDGCSEQTYTRICCFRARLSFKMKVITALCRSLDSKNRHVNRTRYVLEDMKTNICSGKLELECAMTKN